ncbi:MAG: hypothetical protein QM723_27820 [Myxococcaceae bacterium]
MSDELKPWLQEGAPSGVSKLLESAASDGPSAAALGKLSAKLAAAGLFAPGGGGGGGGHGGDGGGGAAHPHGADQAASHAASHASAAKATGAAAKAVSVAKPVALGAKMLLIGSATVAAVGGGAFQAGRVVERHAQEKRVAQVAKAPVVVSTPTPPPPPPQVDVPEPEPTPEAVLPPVKQVVKPKPAEPVSPEQEAELLTRAMGASQQSQWAEALAAAEQHARKFPNGSLAQEREMIAIESLLRLGRRADAERRAEKFRKAWPTSTHLVRLNTMLKE